MVPTELLLRFPCFQKGDDSSLQRLAAITRRVHVDAGEVLFEQGEPSSELFVVVSGSIVVTQRLGKLPEMTVDTAKEGDLVGWSAMAHPHVRRSTCRAVEPSELLAIQAGPLRDLCAEVPELGFSLMELVSQTISRRLAGAWSQVHPGGAASDEG